MDLYRKFTPKGRQLIFVFTALLFAAGIALALQAAAWSRDAVISENDRHLSQLASTVDHNIGAVLSRCRTELSGQVSSHRFQSAERTFEEGGSSDALLECLLEGAVLLPAYAERIIVRRGSDVLLSTVENDRLNYSILTENEADDIWLCIDRESGKSYLALSCPSRTCGSVYYVLVDLEPFFRRVVVNTVYEDYWVVLYEDGSGLTLQNDYTQPEYEIFSAEEILSRNDGYTRIFEHEKDGVAGPSAYSYTAEDGQEQTVRIYVIPSAASENRSFSTAVAIYNDRLSVPVRRITLHNILAAVLVAFSAGTVIFLLLHSGRREKELAGEIASLEKEKKLNEEILRQQEQLVHHQKLETIGTMTAGIAHEFNNLLSPIMGNSMLILEKTRTEAPELFDYALEIYEASDRAKELISKISRLSRRQTASSMLPVLPEKLITDVLSMAAASIPGNIRVVKAVRTEKTFPGDENQLESMLLNLVINAVQAMATEGGTLTLSADAAGDTVAIAVSDTGKGIPEENLSMIFDPFFTTKNPGKGTGLGLPIAQHTAMNHGGLIRAENLPQGGAKFTFTVPVPAE